jgi:hypothetical protein
MQLDHWMIDCFRRLVVMCYRELVSGSPAIFSRNVSMCLTRRCHWASIDDRLDTSRPKVEPAYFDSSNAFHFFCFCQNFCLQTSWNFFLVNSVIIRLILGESAQYVMNFKLIYDGWQVYQLAVPCFGWVSVATCESRCPCYWRPRWVRLWWTWWWTSARIHAWISLNYARSSIIISLLSIRFSVHSYFRRVNTIFNNYCFPCSHRIFRRSHGNWQRRSMHSLSYQWSCAKVH